MNQDPQTIGFQLARAGRFDEALPYLDIASRRKPADLDVLHAVASLLVHAERPLDAIERYRIAATLLPNDASVHVGWARLLLIVGDVDQATRVLDRALELDPSIADPGGLLAMTWNPEDPDSACAVLRPLVLRHPDNANLTSQLALALRTSEYLDEARVALERYRSQRPDDPLARVELGRLAINRGDTEQALEQFRAALELAPDNARALTEIALAQRDPMDPPMLARIGQLERSATEAADGMALNDALARHFDRVGDYRTAARHIERMNALQEQMIAPQQRYSTAQHQLEVAFIVDNQTRQFFERLRGIGSADRSPVFIIGLPRSGTTLLERMLAAHPRIVGIGEQHFAREAMQRALVASGGTLDSLSAPAVKAAAEWQAQRMRDRVGRHTTRTAFERIVDKLPDNYLMAGWLSIAFPNAAIIHCLRDPRDVALSCWRTQFSTMRWCSRLDHIAHRIEQHRRLMRHWRATIGDRITGLRYERLVSHPQEEIGRALAAIGVEWNADVLSFSERKGYVGSASRHQVREGLHQRSVEGWRKYEEALAPILARLDAVAAEDAREVAASGIRT